MNREQTTTPNILLLTDDQHRWDFMNHSYIPSLQVPTLEGLQNDGVTLTHTYSNSPICMPTRFTWTYGLYASQGAAKLISNCHDWPTHLPSMPQALQSAGYHTAMIGKLHSMQGLYSRNVIDEEPVTRARGFDDVFEVSGKELSYWYDCQWTEHLRKAGLLEQHRASIEESCWFFNGKESGEPTFLSAEDSVDGFVGAHARRWLEDYNDPRPFFAHIAFCSPHPPYHPVREYAELYRPEDMPIPVGITDPEEIRYWQRVQAAYCGLITQVDDETGKILAVINKRGWSNNTLVIFATDHGNMMGHHHHAENGTPFDTSARTPYLLRWPGVIPAGQLLDGMIEAVDLPATIMEAAGLGDDPTLQLPSSPARSFLQYAQGKCDSHRDYAYSEVHPLSSGGWRMCCERDWKYVRRNDGDLLFDMANDPWECHNLIDDPAQAARISRMRGQLIDSLAQCMAPNIKDHYT